MQTLDVQVQNPVKMPPTLGADGVKTGPKAALNGKTGAETARNGSSFLAMIEKMIAGTMEGKADALKASSLKTTERGAGDGTSVPGEGNTLNKQGSGKTARSAGKTKMKAEMLLAVKAKAAEAAQKSEADGETSAVKTAKAARTGAGQVPSVDAEAAETLAEKTDSLGGRKTFTGSVDPLGADASAGTGAESLAAALLDPKTARQPQADLEPVNRNGGKGGGAEAVESDAAESAKPGKTGSRDRKAIINVRDDRNQAEATAAAGAKSGLEKTVRFDNDGTADMTIGFSAADTGSSSRTDTESRFMEKADGKQGQSFASMLSSELRSNAADFVKTGSIVLRDNNSGLIRLTLNPESLGNVKISLELADNRITGKITVSSKEAYEAFNENLDGLSDAFMQGGFESAGFDLSWSGSGSSGYGQDTERGRVSAPFYASSIPSVMSAGNAADTNMSGYRYNTSSAVNVFA